jgi:plastocyanin
VWEAWRRDARTIVAPTSETGENDVAFEPNAYASRTEVHMRPSRFVTIGIIVAAASCGGSSSSPTGMTNNPPPTPPPAGSVTVTIQDFKFTPAVDTIKVGTTVQWMNNGPSEHSTTSDTGIWDSQGLTPPTGGAGGATFQHTFSQAGTFKYHCTFHPPSLYPMFVGTIVVTN